MRLKRIDPARWHGIANDIEALCDEIAEDPYPDRELDEYPPPTDVEWPEGAVSVEVWRLLCDAAMFARIHAQFPSLDMDSVREAFRSKRA